MITITQFMDLVYNPDRKHCLGKWPPYCPHEKHGKEHDKLQNTQHMCPEYFTSGHEQILFPVGLRRAPLLTFRRRNFLLNFSTPCIQNVNNTGTKKRSIMK